jgi:hypothetical protein
MAARMTEAMWADLSAFDWSHQARRLWPMMAERERLAVVNMAKAERASNVRYESAAKAVERALDREWRRGGSDGK